MQPNFQPKDIALGDYFTRKLQENYFVFKELLNTYQLFAMTEYNF